MGKYCKVVIMYACIHTPAFAVQAAIRTRPDMHSAAVAILDGDAPLEHVIAMNKLASNLGVYLGMTRLQAESFAGVHLLLRSGTQEEQATQVLLASASKYSSQLQSLALKHSPEPSSTYVLDIAGTTSLFGDPYSLALSLRNQVLFHGLISNVAVSKNLLVSACAARGISGITVLLPSDEAKLLGPLPISILDPSPQIAETFSTWGIHTCNQLASLPEEDLIARSGTEGQQLRSLARGELKQHLVPIESSFEASLVEHISLDHPLELVEPLLLFVSSLLDRLLLRVLSRFLAITSLTVVFTYSPSTCDYKCAYYMRTITTSLPTQDKRRLLKLIALQLEIDPPNKPIWSIEIKAQAGRVRVAQHGLYQQQSPEPGTVDILLARLDKLYKANRVGVPELLDSHRTPGFRLATFQPSINIRPSNIKQTLPRTCPTVFRACRPPRVIHVVLANYLPSSLSMNGEQFIVQTSSGPWHCNGEWWSLAQWCREEWDVVLISETSSRQQVNCVCRIAYDPSSHCWYLEGTFD